MNDDEELMVLISAVVEHHANVCAKLVNDIEALFGGDVSSATHEQLIKLVDVFCEEYAHGLEDMNEGVIEF